MGIALTDDHRELGEVARSFLTAQKARWAARELLDAAEEHRPPFWAELAELGWLGLHVDEQYGGSGYGLPELVVVIDELGRAVAPGPFVPTAVVSAVLSAVGTDEQKTRLLPGLIDGSVTAAVGFGGDLTLSGGKVSGDAGVVLGAGLADLLLLTAGDDVVLVDRTADGVSVEVPETWTAPGVRAGDAGRRGRRRQRADRGALGRGGLRAHPVRRRGRGRSVGLCGHRRRIRQGA